MSSGYNIIRWRNKSDGSFLAQRWSGIVWLFTRKLPVYAWITGICRQRCRADGGSRHILACCYVPYCIKRIFWWVTEEKQKSFWWVSSSFLLQRRLISIIDSNSKEPDCSNATTLLFIKEKASLWRDLGLCFWEQH